ncbi:hypothetical protein AVDCRST_MAG84-4607 [uncultured Microcoleus sp.]|uniref:Uncharacterized protein n=1 Tax=uncultured Microcoleus sp. TaxID=259945 RepID=A0A6J4N0Z0_9CYAN|nr:hypothetical protein AVDCRST_MAG84-4607 [uncultured Microcoleus sp.]
MSNSNRFNLDPSDSVETWDLTSEGTIEILTSSGKQITLSEPSDVDAWLEEWGVPVERD